MSTKRKLDTTADSPEVSKSKRLAGALQQYTERNSFLSVVLCADVRGLIAGYLYLDPDYLYVTQCDYSECSVHSNRKTVCCLAHIKDPSRWVCLAAVQRDGWALQYVPELLRT